MVKTVQSWVRKLAPATLVLVGWFAFIGGVCSQQVLWLSIVLLSISRALPTALWAPLAVPQS